MHKDTIAVALAETGKRGEVREHGKVVNTPTALKTLAVKLARNGAKLRFCYEAGPCGCGIQRQLSEAGQECVAVAPSLIPREPGDRIQTDRRDAVRRQSRGADQAQTQKSSRRPHENNRSFARSLFSKVLHYY
jgi:transposase